MRCPEGVGHALGARQSGMGPNRLGSITLWRVRRDLQDALQFAGQRNVTTLDACNHPWNRGPECRVASLFMLQVWISVRTEAVPSRSTSL